MYTISKSNVIGPYLSLSQQVAIHRGSSPFAQCGAAATEEMGVRPIVDAEVEVDSSAYWFKMSAELN